MTEIKRVLMVSEPIRDMAGRLAVTLDVDIEEAVRFALVTTTAMIAASGVSIDELRRRVKDAPPLRQCQACRLPQDLCDCPIHGEVAEKLSTNGAPKAR